MTTFPARAVLFSAVGVAAALCLALFLPSLASAGTFCVNEPACVAAGGIKEAGEGVGLQSALSSAAGHSNSGGPDVVVIGAGTYTHAGGFKYSGDAVEIEGAGRGSTILTDEGAKENRVLELAAVAEGSTPSLENLTIRAPKAENEVGLVLTSGLVDGVAVEGAEDTAAIGLSTGLVMRSGEFENGSVEAIGGDTQGVELAGSGLIVGSTLRGNYVVQGGGVTIRGCRLYGAGTMLDAADSNDTIEDSLLDLLGHAGPVLELLGLHSGGKGTATFRGVTIVNGSAASVGIREYAHTTESGHAEVSVNVQSSIFSHIAHPFEQNTEEAGSLDLATVEYSNVEAGATNISTHLTGGGVSSVNVTNPVPGEPEFLDPVLGSEVLAAADWRTSPASALIDAGAPGPLTEGESPTDLGGEPRISNGRRDVGAYEFQTPTASATASAPTALVTPLVGVKELPPLPALTELRLSPSKFRVGRSGARRGIGQRKAGTTRVSYDSAKGLHVTFTVQRVTTGVRSAGHSCLARKRGRHGKACSRFVAVHGSFARTGAEGKSSFRFTGRLAGHALKPARYLLIASWTQEGRSERATVAFRVLA